MNRYLVYTNIFLFSFVLSTACNFKDPSGHQTESSLLPGNALDIDPYYVESAITTGSLGPASITRNILEDRKGNIWLATWEGIIRFEGHTFTNYTNIEGLRRYHVFSVFEDRKGNIWFGTMGAGIYLYDGKTFTNITTKEGLVNNRVACFFEDKAGNIWIGTEGGISIYNPSENISPGQKITFQNLTRDEGLPNNDVNSIIEDGTGKIWIVTRGEACTYDFYQGGESGEEARFTILTNKEGVPFQNVRSIIEDEKGNIWLGGNDGLWRYNAGLWSQFTTNFVGYIYQDRAGNIWTSSEDKLANDWIMSRYDKNTLTRDQIVPNQIKPNIGMLFGILEDRNGNIWFGHLNGVGRIAVNSIGEGGEVETFYYFRE